MGNLSHFLESSQMYILLIKYKSTTPVQTFLKGFTAKQFLADMS